MKHIAFIGLAILLVLGIGIPADADALYEDIFQFISSYANALNMNKAETLSSIRVLDDQEFSDATYSIVQMGNLYISISSETGRVIAVKLFGQSVEISSRELHALIASLETPYDYSNSLSSWTTETMSHTLNIITELMNGLMKGETTSFQGDRYLFLARGDAAGLFEVSATPIIAE